MENTYCNFCRHYCRYDWAMNTFICYAFMKNIWSMICFVSHFQTDRQRQTAMTGYTPHTHHISCLTLYGPFFDDLLSRYFVTCVCVCVGAGGVPIIKILAFNFQHCRFKAGKCLLDVTQSAASVACCARNNTGLLMPVLTGCKHGFRSCSSIDFPDEKALRQITAGLSGYTSTMVE